MTSAASIHGEQDASAATVLLVFDFLRNWPQLSSLPADLREQLDAEAVIFIADKVGVSRHFSGHVPGVYSSSGVARYRGAFAFTATRVVATFPTGADPRLRAVDCHWDTPPGPARATITDNGLKIDIDLRSVDHAFSGTMSLTYKRSIPDDVLHALPATQLSFPVDPVFVYRAAGVRPRL
jgi:hypothetical protein